MLYNASKSHTDLTEEEEDFYSILKMRATDPKHGQPFITHMIVRLIPVSAPGLRTMAVDKWYRVYIDFEYMMEKGIEFATQVLNHEPWHLLKDSSGRAESYGSTLDDDVWNLSTDAEINDDIRELIPLNSIFPSSFGSKDDDSAEFYYSEIMKLRNPPQPELPKGSGKPEEESNKSEKDSDDEETQNSSGSPSDKDDDEQSDDESQGEGNKSDEESNEDNDSDSQSKGDKSDESSGAEKEQSDKSQGEDNKDSGSSEKNDAGNDGEESNSSDEKDSTKNEQSDDSNGSNDQKDDNNSKDGNSQSSEPELPPKNGKATNDVNLPSSGGTEFELPKNEVCSTDSKEVEEYLLDEDDGETVSDFDNNIILSEIAKTVQDAEARAPGSVPGHMKLWAENYMKPTPTPWRQLLGSSLRSAIEWTKRSKTDYNKSRPSRRQPVKDILFPAIMTPEMRLLLGVDTSGSHISLLPRVSEEIYTIIKKTGIRGKNLKMISIDTHIRSKPTIVNKITDVSFSGGGGTSMTPFFDYTQKYKKDYDLAILLTDGEVPKWYTTKPVAKIKYIVCILGFEGGSSKAYDKAVEAMSSWAKVIRIEVPRSEL